MVKFYPMDITDEDSINDVLLVIDNAIQYGEDLEPKEKKVWMSKNTIQKFHDFFSSFNSNLEAQLSKI